MTLLTLQHDEVDTWHQGGCLVGTIAIEHSAAPQCEEAPEGRRATVYEMARQAGYRWHVLNSLGVVEARGFIMVGEA